MGWAPTLVGPPPPPQTWGHPHRQLTSHREEKQSRADACRATVEPLLLVPDAPNHHAQTLGDGESTHHHPPKKIPICTLLTASSRLSAETRRSHAMSVPPHLTGTKRTQPTSVPVNADLTISA